MNYTAFVQYALFSLKTLRILNQCFLDSGLKTVVSVNVSLVQVASFFRGSSICGAKSTKQYTRHIKCLTCSFEGKKMMESSNFL